MEYQNDIQISEAKRIRCILKHQAWLEKEHVEAMDLTHLSEIPPLSTTTFLSQLDAAERKNLYERLAKLELIFWSLGDEIIQKKIADRNTQVLNECYDAAKTNRQMMAHTPQIF